MSNVKRDETNGITLLPCPFCGGEAKMTKINHATWVECSNYHYEHHQVSVHAKTEAEAIAAWNTRAERTCKDANTRFNAWTCSECKCTLLLMFDDYGEPTLNVDGVASVPSYCPNCGAKVVDA